jgi:hypothetical protein
MQKANARWNPYRSRNETVDVAAHVDVRVEEEYPLGKQPPQLVVVGRNESASACERLVHGL